MKNRLNNRKLIRMSFVFGFSFVFAVSTFLPQFVAASGVWFQVSPRSAWDDTFPIGFKNLFTQPELWSVGLGRLDTFMFFEAVRNEPEIYDLSFFKNKVVPLFRQHDIKIVYDSGGALWFACRTKESQDESIANDFEFIDFVRRAGGEVASITMMSAMSKTFDPEKRPGLLNRCPDRFDLTKRMEGIVSYMKRIKAVHPSMKFNLSDNTGSYAVHGQNYQEAFNQLFTMLNANGLKLEALILDTNAEPSPGPGTLSYAEIKQLVQFIKDKGVQFGMFLVSYGGGDVSNQSFANHVSDYLNGYLAAGGTADFYVLTSWFHYPDHLLPEDDSANHSQTNNLRRIVAALRSSSGPSPSPSPTVSPSPTPTPTPVPGDITDENDVPGDQVNIYDYNLLVSDFGKTGTAGWLKADIDKNGEVDIFDYNILVENFGK